MPDPAPTAAAVHRSGIRTVFELAAPIPDVIHLELGEPDFPTPPHIVEAAHAAALAGHTGYTSNLGIPPLREAIADKLRRSNGLAEVVVDEVVVTHGATQGLLATLRSLVDPGDGVLVPDPGWPNYRSMVESIHGVVEPYPLRVEAGYRPDPDEVEAAITPRTKVLLLNSPSNPLGATTEPDTARALLAVARRHDLWVVSDECYEDIAFEERTIVVAALADEQPVVSVFSFSKSYAMTGWRVGYVHAPRSVTAVLAGIQEPLVSSVNAPAQHAALAAVTGPQEVVAAMRDSYRDRRDAALEVLAAAGMRAFPPQGAFYLWIDVSAAGRPSADLSRDLVLEHGVAAVPGSAFGALGEGSLRVSLATDVDVLLEGCRRIARHVTAVGSAGRRPAASPAPLAAGSTPRPG